MNDRRGSTAPQIRDLFAVCVIFGVFVFLAHWRRTSETLSTVLPPDRITHLGAEHDSIAVAIREGRGFSDPFRLGTGPTAWMPPVLPYVTAGFYYLSGDDRDSVVTIIACLQGSSVLVTGLMVVVVARRLNAPAIGYLSIILSYLINFHWLFQRTHDVWLLLLVFNLIWIGAIKNWVTLENWIVAIGWGFLGGVIALCSPVAGLTWAVVTAMSPLLRQEFWFWKDKRFVVMTLVAMATVMPWTIRNRLVLGEWIPIKSNAMFEIWQAQCCDGDGVVDLSTFQRCHPYARWGSEEGERYRELGEVKFVESFRPEIRDAIIASPTDGLFRINRRIATALYWYYPLSPLHSGLILTRLISVVYCFPAIGFILVLCWCPPSLRTLANPVLVIYFVALLPYVLISFYTRYLAPLAGMQMLLILFGFESVVRRFNFGNREVNS